MSDGTLFYNFTIYGKISKTLTDVKDFVMMHLCVSGDYRG